MSEEGLKSEIRKLTQTIADLRADLRAERGEVPPGEIVVLRRGTDSTCPTTFHVQMSVDIFRARRDGEPYVSAMLDRMRHEIEREIKNRQPR